MNAKHIKMLKKKIKIISNFIFDRVMPYKRLRKFSIDRWLYKNESERYTKYNYNYKSINIFPEKEFYHPKWDCLVSKTDQRYKFNKNCRIYNFLDIDKFPNKYKQAYSSNFFQTKPIQIVEKLLLQIYNSLLQDGIFRIVIPDVDLAYQAYQDKRIDFFEILSPNNYSFRNEKFYIEIMLATFISGKDIYNLENDRRLGIDIKNAYSRMNKESFFNELINLVSTPRYKYCQINKSWYNYQRLKSLLYDSGFSSIYKSGFGQSKSPQMRDIPLFDSKLPSMSLYVEARK